MLETFNKLFQSITNVEYTENGALSNKTTNNVFLDAFFKFVRNIKTKDIYNHLNTMYDIDKVKTIILIFQTRDIEEGKGERRIFRYCLAWLINKDIETYFKIMNLVKDYGRYDDIIYSFYLYLYTYHNLKKDTNIDDILNEDTKVIYHRICKYYFFVLNSDISVLIKKNMYNQDEKYICKYFSYEIENTNVSLCAKWFISENSKLDRRIKFNKYFCKFNKINPSLLRKKYLSPLRKYINIIETHLTNKTVNNFDIKDLGNIPSQAKLKYKKVLSKTPEWNNYLQSLKKNDGETKINVKTLQPHQIVGEYFSSGIFKKEKNDLVEEMWKNKLIELQSKIKLDKTLVVSDTSGSMYADDSIKVSIALGVLISSLSNNKYFKNHLMTFSENPSLVKIPDSNEKGLFEIIQFLLDSTSFSWGYNTNLYKVFTTLLKHCEKFTNEELKTYMPDTIFIISDMQFDSAIDEKTNFQAIDDLFKEKGVSRPRIVFWNVRANTKDYPITNNDDNVLLLSGNAPQLMKYVIDGKIDNPMLILEEIWKDERYKPIVDLF